MSRDSIASAVALRELKAWRRARDRAAIELQRTRWPAHAQDASRLAWLGRRWIELVGRVLSGGAVSLIAFLVLRCTPVQLGVVPVPAELLVARRVELAVPVGGSLVAFSGDARCVVTRGPVDVGTWLACRWIPA